MGVPSAITVTTGRDRPLVDYHQNLVLLHNSTIHWNTHGGTIGCTQAVGRTKWVQIRIKQYNRMIEIGYAA
jgi:hypothetical protein